MVKSAPKHPRAHSLNLCTPLPATKIISDLNKCSALPVKVFAQSGGREFPRILPYVGFLAVTPQYDAVQCDLLIGLLSRLGR
jgi:hypothetical protein